MTRIRARERVFIYENKSYSTRELSIKFKCKQSNFNTFLTTDFKGIHIVDLDSQSEKSKTILNYLMNGSKPRDTNITKEDMEKPVKPEIDVYPLIKKASKEERDDVCNNCKSIPKKMMRDVVRGFYKFSNKQLVEVKAYYKNLI